MNKIFVFWGLALFAVLTIENMVVPITAYVLWFTSKSFVLVFASTIVWIFIWYWFRWMMLKKSAENSDELDF